MSDDALAQLDRSHRRHDEEMRALIEAAKAGELDAIADAVAFLERSSPRHFADEEESLFPRLRARDPSLGDALDRIAAEHRDHEKRHARLRVRCDAGDAPAVLAEAEALDALYRRHVAEEDELFGRARALLEPSDHVAILAEMDGRRGRRR
jgi:hemerythrin-like domain-containing protein